MPEQKWWMETVTNIEGKKVTRIRSSLFYWSGLMCLIVGSILLYRGIFGGGVLITVISPFLLLYPPVRFLMLGKDSLGAVLITSYFDYRLNKWARSVDKSGRRK